MFSVNFNAVCISLAICFFCFLLCRWALYSDQDLLCLETLFSHFSDNLSFVSSDFLLVSFNDC